MTSKRRYGHVIGDLEFRHHDGVLPHLYICFETFYVQIVVWTLIRREDNWTMYTYFIFIRLHRILTKVIIALSSVRLSSARIAAAMICLVFM